MRAAVEAEPSLARLDVATKRSLLSLAGGVELELRGAILRLARRDEFFVLRPRIQRALLGLLAANEVDLGLIDDVEVLAELLAKFSPLIQAILAGELSRLAGRAEARRTFIELLRADGFLLLCPEVQVELLRYLGGPSASAHASPSRQTKLDELWEKARRAMSVLLATANKEVEERAQQLCDHLHVPCREVYFLRERDSGAHVAIVFGDPRDPEAITYFQVKRQRSRVRSGFRAEDGVHIYEMFVLSREEERAFIQWIEASYTIYGEDETAQLGGAPVRNIQSRDLYAAGMEMLRVLTASRRCPLAEQGWMRGTARSSAPSCSMIEDDCDALLREYLCA
jgi:hypothetical protein